MIIGPTGVGKTSLLRTVDLEHTLFVDAETGDLSVRDAEILISLHSSVASTLCSFRAMGEILRAQGYSEGRRSAHGRLVIRSGTAPITPLGVPSPSRLRRRRSPRSRSQAGEATSSAREAWQLLPLFDPSPVP
jgi:hypothetical protein